MVAERRDRDYDRFSSHHKIELQQSLLETADRLLLYGHQLQPRRYLWAVATSGPKSIHSNNGDRPHNQADLPAVSRDDLKLRACQSSRNRILY